MSSGDSTNGSSWFERLTRLFSDEPENRDELLRILQEAENQSLIDSDALLMIEGVLGVSEMRVRDIMVSRTKVNVIDESLPLEEILQEIVESAHSRYPVISENKDEILGVLLAKDVLRLLVQGKLSSKSDLRSLYRAPVFVPESKRLNVLLREFKSSHNHLALVVDEFAALAGLVTIEDVLEQIVGDIEDEHDEDDQENIQARNNGVFSVRATTPIDEFNSYFDCGLECGADIDTLGGMITSQVGRVPQKGEEIILDGFLFRVARADSRRVRFFVVKKIEEEATD